MGAELGIWMQTGSWIVLTNIDLLVVCAIWTIPTTFIMVYAAVIAVIFYRDWLLELEAGKWGRKWEPTEDVEQPLLGPPVSNYTN